MGVVSEKVGVVKQTYVCLPPPPPPQFNLVDIAVTMLSSMSLVSIYPMSCVKYLQPSKAELMLHFSRMCSICWQHWCCLYLFITSSRSSPCSSSTSNGRWKSFYCYSFVHTVTHVPDSHPSTPTSVYACLCHAPWSTVPPSSFSFAARNFTRYAELIIALFLFTCTTFYFLAAISVPQPAPKDAPPPWIQMREQQKKETAKKEIIQDLQKLQAKEQVELDDNTAAEPLESQFSAAVQHAMESCSKDSIAVRN